MEHEKTFDGQIHASIAKRAGEILSNYEGPYEVTLCLSLLQTLLTQFMESKESQKSESFEKWLNREWTEADGTIENSEKQNSPLLIKNVLESLRHALSHPNDQYDAKYPVTGFSEYNSRSTSIQSTPQEIEGFKFIHSPDVKKDGSGINNRKNQHRLLTLKLNKDQILHLTLELSKQLSSALSISQNSHVH